MTEQHGASSRGGEEEDGTQNETARADGRETMFFIDKEKFEASTDDLTPRQILTQYAKEDPAQTILVLIHGKDRTKLENLDQPIELQNGTRFTILHQGPTPAS